MLILLLPDLPKAEEALAFGFDLEERDERFELSDSYK